MYIIVSVCGLASHMALKSSMPDEGTTIRIHLPYIPYEPEKLELLENGKMQELKGP